VLAVSSAANGEALQEQGRVLFFTRNNLETKKKDLKEVLLNYNEDDVRATKVVKGFLAKL
jgi:predicted RecB family nuclease